jgi:hypothetical protein
MNKTSGGPALRAAERPVRLPSPAPDKPWDDRILPERIDPWPPPPPPPPALPGEPDKEP